MKKQLITVLAAVLFCLGAIAQHASAEVQIRQLLATQTRAWNSGNIAEFMQPYWQNDSLLFVGSDGPTYGWKNTLDRYKKKYDTKEKMGTLSFAIQQLKPLGSTHYLVLGQWKLKRVVGDASGYFTLTLQKFKSGWKIIADHSS